MQQVCGYIQFLIEQSLGHGFLEYESRFGLWNIRTQFVFGEGSSFNFMPDVLSIEFFLCKFACDSFAVAVENPTVFNFCIENILEMLAVFSVVPFISHKCPGFFHGLLPRHCIDPWSFF